MFVIHLITRTKNTTKSGGDWSFAELCFRNFQRSTFQRSPFTEKFLSCIYCGNFILIVTGIYHGVVYSFVYRSGVSVVKHSPLEEVLGSIQVCALPKTLYKW